jgi:hypothetical protein
MVIPLPYGPFHFKRISGEINKQKKKKKNPFFPSLLFSFSFLKRRRLLQEEHGISDGLSSYTFLSSVFSTLLAPHRRKETEETLINRIKKNQNRQGTLATSLLANNIKSRGALLLLVAPATKQHSSFFYYIKCSKQYHIVL